MREVVPAAMTWYTYATEMAAQLRKGPYMLDVRIDPKRCVAYGRCAAIASGAFQVDEETRKAFIDEEELKEVTTQQIFAAARACPTQAISIEQFGRRLYPQIVPPMRGVEKAEQGTQADSDEHS